MLGLIAGNGDVNQTTRQEFLNDLCPRIRPLIACTMDCPCGCETLDLLRVRSNTWLTASDIAYHVSAPIEHVQAALDLFVRTGFVERLEAVGWTFYAIARDGKTPIALEQFWLQRDDWRDRVTRVQATLRLRHAA